MGGGGYYFWLGASADADQALVSDQAASRLAPAGFDPSRTSEYLDAFCDLTIACVNWAGVSDEILMHYPVEEMERAIALLDPIYGEPGLLQ